MSQGSVPADHRDRSLEERLALALPPALVRILLWGVIRLAPGSPLRRRILKRAFARGLEGPSRGHYELSLLFYEPDVETRIYADITRVLGYSEVYRGHQGYIDAWRDIQGDVEDFQLVPEQIVDRGDRVAVRMQMVGRGRRSGIETSETQGGVYFFSTRGLIARQEIHRSWDDALAALTGED